MAAYRVAGMIKDADATAMREDIVEATVVLKVCSRRPYPPAMKQQPSTYNRQDLESESADLLTSSMFDKILPSILDCTIRISPFLSATMLT